MLRQTAARSPGGNRPAAAVAPDQADAVVGGQPETAVRRRRWARRRVLADARVHGRGARGAPRLRPGARRVEGARLAAGVDGGVHPRGGKDAECRSQVASSARRDSKPANSRTVHAEPPSTAPRAPAPTTRSSPRRRLRRRLGLVESVVKVLLARPSEAAAAVAATRFAQHTRAAPCRPPRSSTGASPRSSTSCAFSPKGASVVQVRAPWRGRRARPLAPHATRRRPTCATATASPGRRVALLHDERRRGGRRRHRTRRGAELATAIVSALCNLAAQPACAEDVCESGGVAALVALCIPRHPCAADAVAGVQPRGDGVIPSVRARRAGSRSSSSSAGVRPRWRTRRRARVQPRVRPAESRAQIRDHGGIGALVKRPRIRPRRGGGARGGDLRDGGGGGAAKEETAQEVIRNEMGFKPIGAMLAEVEREAGGLTDGTAYALDAVTELATNPHNRDEALRRRPPPSAVLILRSRSSPPTAAFALHKLAANAGNEGAIRKAGGDPPARRPVGPLGERAHVGARRAVQPRVHRRAQPLGDPRGGRHPPPRAPRARLPTARPSTTRCRSGRRRRSSTWRRAVDERRGDGRGDPLPPRDVQAAPRRGVDAAKSKDPKKAARRRRRRRFATAAESAAGARRNSRVLAREPAADPRGRRRRRRPPQAARGGPRDAGGAARRGVADQPAVQERRQSSARVLGDRVAKRGTPAERSHLDKTLLLVAEVRQREARGTSRRPPSSTRRCSAEVEPSREAQSVLKTACRAPHVAGSHHGAPPQRARTRRRCACAARRKPDVCSWGGSASRRTLAGRSRIARRARRRRSAHLADGAEAVASAAASSRARPAALLLGLSARQRGARQSDRAEKRQARDPAHPPKLTEEHSRRRRRGGRRKSSGGGTSPGRAAASKSDIATLAPSHPRAHGGGDRLQRARDGAPVTDCDGTTCAPPGGVRAVPDNSLRRRARRRWTRGRGARRRRRVQGLCGGPERRAREDAVGASLARGARGERKAAEKARGGKAEVVVPPLLEALNRKHRSANLKRDKKARDAALAVRPCRGRPSPRSRAAADTAAAAARLMPADNDDASRLPRDDERIVAPTARSMRLDLGPLAAESSPASTERCSPSTSSLSGLTSGRSTRARCRLARRPRRGAAAATAQPRPLTDAERLLLASTQRILGLRSARRSGGGDGSALAGARSRARPRRCEAHRWRRRADACRRSLRRRRAPDDGVLGCGPRAVESPRGAIVDERLRAAGREAAGQRGARRSSG